MVNPGVDANLGGQEIFSGEVSRFEAWCYLWRSLCSIVMITHLSRPYKQVHSQDGRYGQRTRIETITANIVADDKWNLAQYVEIAKSSISEIRAKFAFANCHFGTIDQDLFRYAQVKPGTEG